MEVENESGYAMSEEIEYNAEAINEEANGGLANTGEDVDIQNITNEFGNLNFQEITKEQIIQSVKEKFPTQNNTI